MVDLHPDKHSILDFFHLVHTMYIRRLVNSLDAVPNDYIHALN